MEQQGYAENAKHKQNAPSPTPEFPKIRPTVKAIIGGEQIIAKHNLIRALSHSGQRYRTIHHCINAKTGAMGSKQEHT